MTTTTVDPARAQPYDRFKLIVAIILAALLIVICLLAQSAAQVASVPPTATVAAATATSAPPTNPPPTAIPISAPTLDGLAADLEPGAIPLSGTGTPNSTVQIVIDGQVAGTAAVGADGKWTFEADLAAGEHEIEVNALDAAGGAVAASAAPLALTLSLPLEAPALDDLAADLKPGTIPLSGTGTPNSRVQIVIDGQVAGEAEVGADGKWTFDADLAAGQHEIEVNALDASGAVAAAAEPATIQLAEAVPTPTATPPVSPATPLPIRSICDFSDPTVYGEDKGTYWLVDRCDTMSYIARQTNIPLAALIAANPQVTNPDLIYPTQQIVLPGR